MRSNKFCKMSSSTYAKILLIYSQFPPEIHLFLVSIKMTGNTSASKDHCSQFRHPSGRLSTSQTFPRRKSWLGCTVYCYRKYLIADEDVSHEGEVKISKNIRFVSLALIDNTPCFDAFDKEIFTLNGG